MEKITNDNKGVIYFIHIFNKNREHTTILDWFYKAMKKYGGKLCLLILKK